MATKYKYLIVNNKFMTQHRHVMELHLNRKLQTSELIYHKNENGLDNNIENLTLTTRSKHMKIHDPGKETCFKKQYFLDKDKVCNLYHIQNKSLAQIAQILNASVMTVQRFMKTNNIICKNNRGMRDAHK